MPRYVSIDARDGLVFGVHSARIDKYIINLTTLAAVVAAATAATVLAPAPEAAS
jgi:hypothetical protein